MAEKELPNKESPKAEVRIFLEAQGTGIKEKFDNYDLVNQPVHIESDDKVVLIGPDNGNKGTKDEGSVPNLHNGLFRIQAYLHEHGTNSAMVNADIDKMEQAWEQIGRHKPPFIGFSPYYDTMHRDLKHIDHALDLSPNSVVVIGGYEASLNDQWRDFGGLVDILVRGEGEIPMLTLVQEHQRFSEAYGKDFDKQKFLDFLKGSPEINKVPAISVLEPGKTAEITPLDRITTEFYNEISLNAFEKHLDLSPFEKYWRVGKAMFKGKKETFFRFITRDFCPYKCVFCESPVLYAALMGKEKSGAVRIIDTEVTNRIVKAVTAKFPFAEIMFDDDNFMVYPQRARETLQGIIEGKKKGEIREDLLLNLRCRTDNIVNNPEFPKLFKQAGVHILSMGSESYSQHELDSMIKQTTPETNLKAVKLLLEAGISVSENYLTFTPHVTKDSFYENASAIVRNIRDFGIDGVVTPFLSPIPKTPLWGDGNFEIVQDFPYEDLHPGKIMFRNQKAGYEYFGSLIKVPRTSITLRHPEFVLVKDPLMRDVSINSTRYLPQAIDKLKGIKPDANLSRSFGSLAQLWAASSLLYELTNESRWHQMRQEIEGTVEKKDPASTPEFCY